MWSKSTARVPQDEAVCNARGKTTEAAKCRIFAWHGNKGGYDGRIAISRLKRIPDSYVIDNVFALPGGVLGFYFVDDPGVLVEGQEPGIADGYADIEAEDEYLEIEAEAQADIGCELLVEVGGELTAGECGIGMEEPDVACICKEAEANELVYLLAELYIAFQLQVAKGFDIASVVGVVISVEGAGAKEAGGKASEVAIAAGPEFLDVWEGLRIAIGYADACHNAGGDDSAGREPEVVAKIGLELEVLGIGGTEDGLRVCLVVCIFGNAQEVAGEIDKSVEIKGVCPGYIRLRIVGEFVGGAKDYTVEDKIAI